MPSRGQITGSGAPGEIIRELMLCPNSPQEFGSPSEKNQQKIRT